MSEIFKPAQTGHTPETAESRMDAEKEKSAIDIQIEQMLNLPDDPEAINSYVQQRKEALGKNSIRTLEKMQMFFEPIVEGFFDDEMKIQPGISENATFSLDDDAIYTELIKAIKGYHEYLDTRFGGDRHRFALRTVQHATTYYFGNIYPSAEEQAVRAEKFDTFSPEKNNYSIADNKQSAMCAERTAVAHNLLLFCGDNSRYVGGYLKEEWPDRDSSEELHAYLLVEKGEGEYEVFDPANPTLVYADDSFQELQAFVPFVIGTGSTELPKRGEQYESQSEFVYLDNGQRQSRPRSKRFYTIGPKR